MKKAHLSDTPNGVFTQIEVEVGIEILI